MYFIYRLYLLIFSVLCLICLNSGENYVCNPNLSCGCSLGSTSVTAKIVGGEAAADNAWGWTAQLLKSGSFLCGAVLISNSYAVTAAHCLITTSDPTELSIIAGTNYFLNSNGAGQQKTVIQYYIHPNFNIGLGTNDIGVLHFSPLTITSGVKFICLPTAGVDPYALGSNVVLTGWGLTSENNGGPSAVLQQVTVQIIPSGNLACQRALLVDANVQVCAGNVNGGKDSCHGDSGGPLMIFNGERWVLGGLTASGVGCAQPGFAGIYTRASAFVSFIENAINSLNSTTSPTTQATSNQQGSSGAATSLVQLTLKPIIFLLLIILNI